MCIQSEVVQSFTGVLMARLDGREVVVVSTDVRSAAGLACKHNIVPFSALRNV